MTDYFLYITLALFSVIFIIEVYHDDQLRKIRNFVGEEADDFTDKWHKLDWWSWTIISILVGIAYFGITDRYSAIAIPVMIAMLRVLILNIWGNKLARRETFYLGSGWIENKFKKKPVLYYTGVLLVFIISITILMLWNQRYGF